jgi:cbb3-type cytochrome oxidase cytochrome c subunit
MKRFELATVAALLLLAFGAPARADDAKKASPEGKAVFLKHTCTTCHTIASQGIGSKEAKASDAKPAAAGAARKPPDLSDVGATRKADWIKLFLTRKEKIDGRSHLLRFRGTDAELTLLAGWLESLKGDKTTKKAAAGKSSEAVEKAKEAAESAGEAAKKSGEAAEMSKEAAKKADEAADKAKDAAEEAEEEGK